MWFMKVSFLVVTLLLFVFVVFWWMLDAVYACFVGLLSLSVYNCAAGAFNEVITSVLSCDDDTI